MRREETGVVERCTPAELRTRIQGVTEDIREGRAETRKKGSKER